MKKLTFYRVVMFLLLLFLMFFIEITHRQYMDLVAVNNDLLELIDRNRAGYDEVLTNWKNSYSELQNDYGAKIVECEKLKDQMESVSIPEYSFSEAEITLLAVCVQCEAGENNSVSQRYITSVIFNRVQSGEFPNTIEEVIYQKDNGCPQFSVAYNGMMDKCVLSPKVLANVYSVIVCGNDLPENVMYFYSASLEENNWVRTLEVYDTVEGTVFAYE